MKSERISKCFAIRFNTSFSNEAIFLRQLGMTFSHNGFKTLLFDLNPWTRLTSFFGVEENCEDFMSEKMNFLPTILEVIGWQKDGGRCEKIHFQKAVKVLSSNLFLLPSDKRLAHWEFAPSKKERKDRFLQLKEVLNNLQQKYDIILINCPEDKFDLSLYSLALAEGVIVFLTLNDYTITHLNSFIRWLKEVNGEEGILQFREKQFLLVPVRFDKEDLRQKKTLQILKKNYGKYISEMGFPSSTQVKEQTHLFMNLTQKLREIVLFKSPTPSKANASWPSSTATRRALC